MKLKRGLSLFIVVVFILVPFSMAYAQERNEKGSELSELTDQILTETEEESL